MQGFGWNNDFFRERLLHTALVASVITALRGRELLLVLDNCEHLLPAAPRVADLLEGVAGLRVIATSREALRLSGEHEFLVASPASLKAQMDAGRVRPLVITSAKRLPAFPDVPTMGESG